MRKALKLLWDSLITLSLIWIIVTLAVDFFIPVDKELLHIMHDVEIFALSFLFVELFYDFYKSKDRKKFVTKEWLLIISFLPLGTILRLARVVRYSSFYQRLNTIWIRIKAILRIEQAGAKTAQSIVHASKISRAVRPAAQFLSRKDERLEGIRKRY